MKDQAEADPETSMKERAAMAVGTLYASTVLVVLMGSVLTVTDCCFENSITSSPRRARVAQ